MRYFNPATIVLPLALALCTGSVEAAAASSNEIYAIVHSSSANAFKEKALGEIALRHKAKDFDSIHGCLTSDELDTYFSIVAAERAQSLEDYRQSSVQAEPYIKRFASNLYRVKSRQPPLGIAGADAEKYMPIQGGDRSWEGKILTMAVLDQYLRASFEGRIPYDGIDPLSRASRARVSQYVSWQTCQYSISHARELYSIVSKRGWPKNKDLSDAAWLIAQHADAEPEIQRKLAIAMKKSTNSDLNTTRKVEYAMIMDRIDVNSGKRQYYGTQGHCVETGVWSPYPIRRASDVDRRRLSIDLPPLEVYVASMKRRCE